MQYNVGLPWHPGHTMSGHAQLIEPPGQRSRWSCDLDDLVPAGRAGHQCDMTPRCAERAGHCPQRGFRRRAPRPAWRSRRRPGHRRGARPLPCVRHLAGHAPRPAALHCAGARRPWPPSWPSVPSALTITLRLPSSVPGTRHEGVSSSGPGRSREGRRWSRYDQSAIGTGGSSSPPASSVPCRCRCRAGQVVASCARNSGRCAGQPHRHGHVPRPILNC